MTITTNPAKPTPAETRASPASTATAATDPVLEALFESFMQMTHDGLAHATALTAEARENLDDNVDITNQIFRLVHDIKGQGLTFGYPLLSRIGASLCDFIRYVTKPVSDEQLGVVSLHLEALSFVIKNDIKGEPGDSYQRLVSQLDHLVQKTETPS